MCLGVGATDGGVGGALRPDPIECRSKRSHVARGNELGTIEALEGVAKALDVRGDDRRSAGKRLEHHQTEPLEGDRGNHRDVRSLVPGHKARIIHTASERHRRTQLLRERLEARALWSLAHDDQASPRDRAAADGLDGGLESHPVAQAPHGDHEEADLGIDAEQPSCGRLVAAHEPCGVDPRRDPADHRRIDPVALRHQRLEGARQHDHPVSPPVDRALDPPLDAGVDASAALGGALVSPRALEVDHQRPTAKAAEQRPQGVEGEVGVDDVGERSTTGGSAHRGKASPEGCVLRSRPDESVARHRGLPAQDHALSFEVLRAFGDHEIGEVPVQPSWTDGGVLEADVPDGGPGHRVEERRCVMRSSTGDAAASRVPRPAPGPRPPP